MSLSIDNDILWIAAYDKGIIKYNIEHNKFYQYFAQLSTIINQIRVIQE